MRSMLEAKDNISFPKKTIVSIFEDLEYADNITLVAHTHHHIILEKTRNLEAMNKQVGLNKYRRSQK